MCGAGVLLQIAVTQYPDDELSGEKYNYFFNEHIAEVVFFPLQKPLVSHINERHLLLTEARALALSLYISHPTVNKGLKLNCYIIIQSRCPKRSEFFIKNQPNPPWKTVFIAE